MRLIHLSKSIFLLLPVTILVIILYMPDIQNLKAGKMLYFHVPAAWVAIIAFITAIIFSCLQLIRKNGSALNEARKAYISVQIGTLFTILSIISGAIWAKIEWGSYWNWDPRQVSILMLLLFYCSYLSLYSTITEKEKRDTIGSIYLLFTIAIVPLLMFIIPRMQKQTLHPDSMMSPNNSNAHDPAVYYGLILSICTFSVLFVYLFQCMAQRTNEK